MGNTLYGTATIRVPGGRATGLLAGGWLNVVHDTDPYMVHVRCGTRLFLFSHGVAVAMREGDHVYVLCSEHRHAATRDNAVTAQRVEEHVMLLLSQLTNVYLHYVTQDQLDRWLTGKE